MPYKQIFAKIGCASFQKGGIKLDLAMWLLGIIAKNMKIKSNKRCGLKMFLKEKTAPTIIIC